MQKTPWKLTNLCTQFDSLQFGELTVLYETYVILKISLIDEENLPSFKKQMLATFDKGTIYYFYQYY